MSTLLKSTTKIFAILIVILTLLFLSSISRAAGKLEGETLVMQAFDQIRENLDNKNTFVSKDDSYIQVRITGETKTIGIYFFIPALHTNDEVLGNKQLIDIASDIAIKSLAQMYNRIKQGDTNNMMFTGEASTEEGPVYMLLMFSSSDFSPENYDFAQQAIELINEELIHKNVLIMEDGTPLLVWIASIGDYKTATKLLEIGTDINIKRESSGETALIATSLNGYDDLAELLLENGALIDAVDNCGKTALMLASKKGYIEVVKKLLNKKASLDITDKDGWNALMLAVFYGHIEIAEALLAKGANLDLADKDSWTALMYAYIKNHTEIAALLIKYGAATDLKNKDGLTARMLSDLLGSEIKFDNGQKNNSNKLPQVEFDPLEQYIYEVKSTNKDNTNIYIISYISNSKVWEYWTEHYNIALKHDKISNILKGNFVCLFSKILSNNKKRIACLDKPAT